MPQYEEITWSVVTHRHIEHSTDWYWGLGLLTLVGAGAAIYFGDLLLGVILLIGGISIAVLKLRGPREHDVKLNGRGATLDGTVYPWKSIQSFWINVSPHTSTSHLYFTTHSLIMPRIVVPLDSDAHSQQVRSFCLQYVPETDEENQRLHFLEHLVEAIGL